MKYNVDVGWKKLEASLEEVMDSKLEDGREYMFSVMFEGESWEGDEATITRDQVFWTAEPFGYRKQAKTIGEAIEKLSGDLDGGIVVWAEISFWESRQSMRMIEFALADEGGDE